MSSPVKNDGLGKGDYRFGITLVDLKAGVPVINQTPGQAAPVSQGGSNLSPYQAAIGRGFRLCRYQQRDSSSHQRQHSETAHLLPKILMVRKIAHV
jgi:hypothetical protein